MGREIYLGLKRWRRFAATALRLGFSPATFQSRSDFRMSCARCCASTRSNGARNILGIETLAAICRNRVAVGIFTCNVSIQIGFPDELRALLRKHEIEWGEKYTWD